MSMWIKLVAGVAAVAALWWGLSSFDYEHYLSPATLALWLKDAGPLAPLLLIGSMVAAVIIPPIPSLPLDLARRGSVRPVSWRPLCGDRRRDRRDCLLSCGTVLRP
jgi:hypothetical protein